MRTIQYGVLIAPLLAAVMAGVACSGSPSSSSSSSSAQAGAGAGFTVLGTSRHPYARPENEAGRVNPGTPLEGMSLLLGKTPEQAARANETLAELQNPSSPSYHHWLTPAAYAASFGAPLADIGRATSWLEAQGFTVHGASANGTRILFSGSVGQVERAFRAEMHYFDVRGARHFALSTAPAVPDSLAGLVMGLRGVNDFRLRPASGPSKRVRPDYLSDAGYPTPGNAVTLAPSDFASIYDINGLYAAGITGAGQKIAIVGEGDFNDADILAFRTAFGLDTTNLPAHVLLPHSGKTYHDPDTMGEAELDLEWSGGIAKDASVTYIYSGENPAYDVFDAVLYAIEDGSYPVISISYAGCEYGQTPSDMIFLEAMGDAAAMEGVSVLAGSGDWGASGCDTSYNETAAQYGLSVSWPAAIPSFVAVGGTEFNWGDAIPQAPVTSAIAKGAPFSDYWDCKVSAGTCAALGYVPEQGWNELTWQLANLDYWWGSTGGGTSIVYPKPAWQTATTLSGSYRQLPDVALSAAWSQVGYEVTGSWTTADGTSYPPEPEAFSVSGGTSAATPSFAAILALVNNALAVQNPGAPVGLGNPNPVLYALQASTAGGAAPVFHDITTGDNIVPCTKGSQDCPKKAPFQYGYSAGAGYDMVTGLGSVDVGNLVAAWQALTPTTTTLVVKAPDKTEGSSVTLTATVSSGSRKKPMTGSVLFYADTVDDGGVADLSLMATGTLVAGLSGKHESGSSTTSIVVPPGLSGKANVVAFYSGDRDYLASWSTAHSVTATSTFAISPSSLTVKPGASATIASTGGVAPVQWALLHDGTCNNRFTACSEVNTLTTTSATFYAGPKAGTVTIVGVDADGAEARVSVTVK